MDVKIHFIIIIKIEMDFVFTVKILIIIIIAFLVVTSADELIDRLIFQIFGLSRESIWSWLIVFIISIILLFIVLWAFKIEAHQIYGLDEVIVRKTPTK